jgi:rfaE bifunctional protein kinase chain/domain
MSGQVELNPYPSLEELFDAFQNLRVLIIGDIMIDSYLWGRVDRISPEAPVPIVQVEKRDFRPGGAANVALNVQALGAKVSLCAIVGKDADGTRLLDILRECQIDASGVAQSEERLTTIKHRIIAASHHLLRVDQESDHPLSSAEEKVVSRHILAKLEQCDVVIFEDYDKGLITPSLIKTVVEACIQKGIPTVVDPKKRNFMAYEKVSLFKPNKKEILEGLKLDGLSSHEEIEKGVDLLKEKLGCERVLLTLSEKGVFFDAHGSRFYIPAHPRAIADVSGAGDTVVAIAALCLGLGLPPRLIAELSNLGGGLVCEKVGVVPIDKKELLQEARNTLTI